MTARRLWAILPEIKFMIQRPATRNYILKIKTVSLKFNPKLDNHDMIKQGLKLLKKQKEIKPIKPFYNKKPNISY